MASTINAKKPCSKCGFEGWVFPCDGCHASFCVKHALDHRTELATQLNNIQEQYDHLQHIYNQHEKRQEHPLFSQIDVWENDTMTKIQQTAQIARDELRQLLDESNNRMKTIFNQFNNQLQTERQTEHYTEIELDQWKEQLMNIKKQLETSCDIELIPDNNLPPIHLIKVNTTQQNALIQNPSLIQPVQLCEDTNNIECSCDNDELDKSQSSILQIDAECEPVLEQNELSTIRKEEPELNLDSACALSTESVILLDPIQNNDLILLQLFSTLRSKLITILNELTDHKLQIFNQKDDCLNELQCSEQTTIFIDLFDTPLNEQMSLLDNISQLDHVYFIYIRGIPSDDENERADFFRRYSKIKAIFENEQRLMVQWAIDTANEYKKTGDIYVQNGEKDKGRKCFEHGITLYKHLSVFLNKKRDVR
jgi:hypothetical protein